MEKYLLRRSLWWYVIGVCFAFAGCTSASPTITQDQSARWNASWRAGIAAYQEGRYSESERLYLAALVDAEQLKPRDWRLAVTLNDLGTLYVEWQRYDDAETHLQRARSVWEEVEGPRHAGTATTLNNLGELYRQLHRYAEA